MSKTKSKPRGKNNSLTRRQGTKQPGQRILIVTEGETEKAYFDAIRKRWKLHSVVVVENPDCTDPVSLLYHAEEKNRDKGIFGGGYDTVWIVYDLEKPNSTDRRNQSQRVKDKITGKNYKQQFRLAISDPSFEFWYVLHFDKTAKNYTGADEVEKHLKKYWDGYKKGTLSDKEIENILPKTLTAIENARWVREQLEGSNSKAPMTDIDKLWEHSSKEDKLPSLRSMCFEAKEEGKKH
jgi:tRNA-dihydrouridine synthase